MCTTSARACQALLYSGLNPRGPAPSRGRTSPPNGLSFNAVRVSVERQRARVWAWRLLLALAAVAAVSMGAAWSTRAGVMAFQRLKRPQLLSLRYGRFRPRGAPHSYYALKLRVRVPGGQVVETEFSDRRSHFGAIADSPCGLGGRKSGGVETSYTPTMKRFVRGVQDVHVTVLASSCNRTNETRKASRTFRLVVKCPPDRQDAVASREGIRRRALGSLRNRPRGNNGQLRFTNTTTGFNYVSHTQLR